MSGRPRKHSPEVEAALNAWALELEAARERVRALGSLAKKAAEIGVSVSTVLNILSRGEYRRQMNLRRKCREAGVPYEEPK